MCPDYKTDPRYRFYNGKHIESHLYEGIKPAEFYDKLENVLADQTNAFKVNIALGYDLVSLTVVILPSTGTQIWLILTYLRPLLLSTVDPISVRKLSQRSGPWSWQTR
ncbi:unnamed protein product [Phytophthora lilii]|uniref:Unnamed protein product n=1 Tax=Phytophthora lilii TaxID=2077276 RepID=A0A9W6TBQ7_9STRA|nr:unnamed protein product [Phytophthora lilii]